MELRSIIAQLLGQNTKRNLWNIFGYPATITIDDYWKRYCRDGIGSRVIKAYPDACWRRAPIVQDEQGSSPKEDQDDYSAFTAAWEDLNERLRVLHYLRRADRLSRVGHFSILVLGFAGTGGLDTPAPKTGELLYMAPYSERSVKIVSFERDTRSPRYGLPLVYEVNPAKDRQSGSTARETVAAFKVHWSRVIHIAEDLDEDDVFGTPALRPIWNNLLDLEKVTGSGAETFWLNARGGMSVEAAADAKLTKDGIADMKSQIEDYENELRRTLAIQGATVKPLTMSIADPTPNFNASIAIISGQTGIPQRILNGSERGELASSEDANSWGARVDERCQQHCGPAILIPFINRMIETGNLPQPQGNWFPQWPDATALSPEKQATIAKTRIEGLTAWANGSADRIVAREEARVMFGLTPESEYDLEEDDDSTDTTLFPPNPLDPSQGQEGNDDPEDDPESEDGPGGVEDQQ